MGLWVVSKKRLNVVKLKLMLSNIISKKVLKLAVKEDENGKTLLEKAFEKYGKEEELPFKEKIKLTPIFKVLDIIRRSFDYDKEKFKTALTDPTIRKIILNSFKSLNKYGLSFPQNFYRPIMVVWNYTNKCNLKCKHCYQNAGPIGETFQELSTKERYQLIDNLAENEIPSLFFSGGEPLIREDFWEIAQYAKEKGFYISIASNGTLFTKENAKKAKEIGFGYIAISLDAVTPEKHDLFRGVKGMWEKSVEGLKNCIQSGIPTCIQYTLSKETIDELPKMLKFRREIGAYRLIVYNYIPVGRGEIESDPTPEEREKIYQLMYEEIELRHSVVATTAPQFGRYCRAYGAKTMIISHYADAKSKELGVIAEVVGGCGAGRAYCAIQPDGSVTPCVYMPKLVIGNLKEERFSDIWENSEVLKTLRSREDLEGHCKECEYKALCGGCRARAYAYYNNIKAPDIGCIFNLEYYNKMKND